MINRASLFPRGDLLVVLVYLPPFAEQLSGAEFAERMKLELVPLMIYGDHVT